MPSSIYTFLCKQALIPEFLAAQGIHNAEDFTQAIKHDRALLVPENLMFYVVRALVNHKYLTLLEALRLPEQEIKQVEATQALLSSQESSLNKVFLEEDRSSSSEVFVSKLLTIIGNAGPVACVLEILNWYATSVSKTLEKMKDSTEQHHTSSWRLS